MKLHCKLPGPTDQSCCYVDGMSGLPKPGTHTDSGISERKRVSSCSEGHCCKTDSDFNDFSVKGKGDTTSTFGKNVVTISFTSMTSNIIIKGTKKT